MTEDPLHGYFRSTAAWRVRIALNLKGTSPAHVSHHLRRNEQCAPDYLQLNPHGLVPTYETGGTALTQSLAIIEYLEETHPTPPLLPAEPPDRARVRAFALTIACDIHPLQNLRVLRKLRPTVSTRIKSRPGRARSSIRVSKPAPSSSPTSPARSALARRRPWPTCA